MHNIVRATMAEILLQTLCDLGIGSKTLQVQRLHGLECFNACSTNMTTYPPNIPGTTVHRLPHTLPLQAARATQRLQLNLAPPSGVEVLTD